MHRTIIAPFVAFLFLLVKIVFGIEVPEHIVSEIVDVIVSVLALGVVLVGIFQNHQKRPDADSDGFNDEVDE